MNALTMRIGGEARPGATTFGALDPTSGEPWARVPEADEQDVADAVHAAQAAFESWGALPGVERARHLREIGRAIADEAEQLALAETRDNGKLLREMRGQIRGLPSWYDYFAGWADKIDGRVVDTGRRDFFGYVTREPVGVVAAIVPWNSPLLLLTFKLAPALAAGCTVVAKPSEHASVSTLLFAGLVERAGLPPGVFNAVSGSRREVGDWLARHPGVDKVSFTGSDTTGIAVAQSAAAHLAPATLELGGKSANIVFADADIDAAVNGLVAGIFAAGGQTCIAGSRALIQVDVYSEIVERLADRAARIVMGDPTHAETEMGPICFPGQHEKIQHYVRDAQTAGATVITGGTDRGLGGLFFEPTILADVSNDARVCQEEIFGPVLNVLPFDDEDEAIALANETVYGLAAGIWSRDLQRVFRIVPKLRVGTVWVNAYRTLNPTMPFGGSKRSGYGRENGAEALDEFLEPKAVWIETSGTTRDPFVLG